MKLLSVDIGSTWTKAVLLRLEGDALSCEARAVVPTTVNDLAQGFFVAPARRITTASLTSKYLRSVLRGKRIERIVVSSVVPMILFLRSGFSLIIVATTSEPSSMMMSIGFSLATSCSSMQRSPWSTNRS